MENNNIHPITSLFQALPNIFALERLYGGGFLCANIDVCICLSACLVLSVYFFFEIRSSQFASQRSPMSTFPDDSSHLKGESEVEAVAGLMG